MQPATLRCSRGADGARIPQSLSENGWRGQPAAPVGNLPTGMAAGVAFKTSARIGHRRRARCVQQVAGAHGVVQAQRADIFIAAVTTTSELRRSGIVERMSPRWGFCASDLVFYKDAAPPELKMACATVGRKGPLPLKYGNLLAT